LLILLALSNRTDAALVVAMLGCYGVLTRRSFAFSWLPLLIGNASYDPALVDCSMYILGDRRRDANA